MRLVSPFSSVLILVFVFSLLSAGSVSSQSTRKRHAESAGGGESAGAKKQKPVNAHPMYVAFSFSKLGLSDFGGDGAWGAAVYSVEQTAAIKSHDACVASSHRPEWCGTADGGQYQVCQADGRTVWVALAINNDGKLENWAYGEALGKDTEDEAARAAMSGCIRTGCHVVWTQAVDCGGGTSGLQPSTCGDKRNAAALEWINTWEVYNRGNAGAIKVVDSAVVVHLDYGDSGVEDTTIPFVTIGEVTVDHVSDRWTVQLSSKASSNFTLRRQGYRKPMFDQMNGDFPLRAINLDFPSEAAAKQAHDFFEYHKCSGK
ncbi:MAG: hypothetical protein C5B55_09425 [Blastocatellia bacterium]|nr:MAG: hypothetical protein C5B55_09425 [Blastocatellia bacterium]